MAFAFLLLIVPALALVGCSEEDCLNCVELPRPVVPTGVESVSLDNLIYVQWVDVTYEPYDLEYNENVVGYRIYSRYFVDGDEDDLDRKFFPIGFVDWDENFDQDYGLHWFYDYDAINGERYEYAVTAVNAAGRESDLSYELVTDAPLPMSAASEEIFDSGSSTPAVAALGGFDFSRLEAGRVDPAAPGTTADIRVVFEGDVPYVEAVGQNVSLLDAGVYSFDDGSLFFDGVSVAPWNGWSATNHLELVVNHIYVAEIIEPSSDPLYPNELHYAKFGVVRVGTRSVRIHWAFQTIAGLPELAVPEPVRFEAPQPVMLDL
ncbi:hypothetical protein DRQ50_10260 [bacterium]|nr:MAG: hypothetical protein DRQ50_10260 [bacterium]